MKTKKHKDSLVIKKKIEREFLKERILKMSM